MDPAPPNWEFFADSTVEAWDPITRVLTLTVNERRFVVSPDIRLTLDKGQRVMLSGYGAGNEWTVTQVLRRSQFERAPRDMIAASAIPIRRRQGVLVSDSLQRWAPKP